MHIFSLHVIYLFDFANYRPKRRCTTRAAVLERCGMHCYATPWYWSQLFVMFIVFQNHRSTYSIALPVKGISAPSMAYSQKRELRQL